jgi:hypothetical protein
MTLIRPTLCLSRSARAALWAALALPGFPVAAAQQLEHPQATPRWLTNNATTHTATLTIIAAYTNALGGFTFNGYGNGQHCLMAQSRSTRSALLTPRYR